MESGVLSEENLSSIFRSISQRRRNGVLEVNYPESQISIFFNKGKVVEAVRSTGTPAVEVLEILKKSGRVPANGKFQSENYGELFRALSEASLPHGVVDEELFGRAVKHRILNILYSLDMKSGAYYTFKMQMVDCDKDFAPSISAGQLLLDFVSLATDAERFSTMFPSSIYIKRGEDSGALSEEETIVFSVLGTRGITVSEIADQTMLSRYHIQDTLLGMYERGAIVTTEDTGNTGQEENADEQATLGELPTSVRGEAFEESQEPLTETEPALGNEERLPKRSFGSPKLMVLNAKLLQSSLIPNLVATLMLVCGLVLPLFMWRNILSKF